MRFLVSLSIACLLATSTYAQYSGGSGTADDPYQIATAADLIALGETPEDYDKHFILTADIDLDPNLPGGKVFDTAVIAPNPLAAGLYEYEGMPFTGVFDGNDHVISRLTLNRDNYLALFGQVDPEGMICNLGVEDVQIASIVGYVGGLVAINNGGTICNCSATGSIESTFGGGGLVFRNISGRIQDCHSSVDIFAFGGVGGLVGVNESGTILDCRSTSNVTAGSHAGGLVGSNTGFIGNCHSGGTVAYGDLAGGLVGSNEAGVIWNCYSTTPVVNCLDRIGGLVGRNGTDGLISGCHSNSVVEGRWYVGGLVGWNEGSVVSMCSSQCSVAGDDNVGGLIGGNEGSVVSMCSSQGSVTGDHCVGGLIGWSTRALVGQVPNREAWVRDCYSHASVVGTSSVGGLVGLNAGTAINCYSNGQVVGETSVGGLMGASPLAYADQIFGFWDMDLSGQPTSAAGVGLTTAQMQDPNMYRSTGWDFVDSWADGTSDIWKMPAEGGCPVLAGPNDYVLPQLQGDGTVENPYLLYDAVELGAVCHYPPWVHYRLGDSIDLAGIRWGAAPIPFLSGTFDGNDLSISNLAIKGTACLGLFGYVRYEAEVKGLNIADANIAGTMRLVGGIAGQNCGDISFCSISGAISGPTNVGGIAGQNALRSRISNCRNESRIEGGDSIGGIAGYNEGTVSCVCNLGSVENSGVCAGGLVGENWSTVANSYNAGPVSGTHGGGLVGEHSWGELNNCYSTGSLQGTNEYSIRPLVGPLSGGRGRGVAAASMGFIGNCFWDIISSGQSFSNYGTGLETAQMQTAAPFLEAGWDFIGETANGIEDIWWIDEGNDYPRLWWELGAENESD